MCVYVHCKTRWEAPVPRARESVLLRQRQVWNKVNFHLIFLHLKIAMFVSECSEDVCLVKNGCDIFFGDSGAKELVIISDHVQTAFSLLKWRRHGQTHVTLIQEMSGQREVLLPINRLW